MPRMDMSRRVNTIIQLTGQNDEDNTGHMGSSISNEHMHESQYDYPNESNDYYYTGSNLTYPRIDEAPSSPKRLSLDDRLDFDQNINLTITSPYDTFDFNRLELELGIKKQCPDPYNANFGPRYPGPMQGQHRPMFHQVGNVVNVVPAEYNAPNQAPRAKMAKAPTQVVRVGNVLEVVPTTNIDWNNGSGQDKAPMAVGPVDGVSMSVPPPAIPVAMPGTPGIATVSPLQHGIPMAIPVPVPVPVPQVVVSPKVKPVPGEVWKD